MGLGTATICRGTLTIDKHSIAGISTILLSTHLTRVGVLAGHFGESSRKPARDAASIKHPLTSNKATIERLGGIETEGYKL
jgi:hypothetical protein